MSDIKIKYDVKAYQFGSPTIYIHTQSLVALVVVEVYWEGKKTSSFMLKKIRFQKSL